MLWVDGVLDPIRLEQLQGDSLVVAVVQHEHYALAYLSKAPNRSGYRFLDPHRFVLQINKSCTELAINFNPAPGEIEKLREFIRASANLRLRG